MKKNREGQATIITLDMQKKIVKAMSGRHALRDRAMFLLGLYSGMRRNEMRLLNIGDVVGPDKRLREEFLLVKGITHQSRTVYLHPTAVQSLTDYIASRSGARASEPLFTSQYGQRIGLSTFSRVFEEAFHTAGIEGASTHSMRRTFITRLHQAGARIKVISQLAGHGNIAVTSRYIEVTEDESRQAVLNL
jgi:integrase/recombinase XerD